MVARKMPPYGINPRFDQDCCPGHSLYPRDSYNNRRSKKAHARDNKIARRSARRRAKLALASDKGE